MIRGYPDIRNTHTHFIRISTEMRTIMIHSMIRGYPDIRSTHTHVSWKCIEVTTIMILYCIERKMYQKKWCTRCTRRCTRPKLEKPRCTRFGRSQPAQGAQGNTPVLLPCAGACARLVRPFALELVQTRGSICWSLGRFGDAKKARGAISVLHKAGTRQNQGKPTPCTRCPPKKSPSALHYITSHYITVQYITLQYITYIIFIQIDVCGES